MARLGQDTASAMEIVQSNFGDDLKEIDDAIAEENDAAAGDDAGDDDDGDPNERPEFARDLSRMMVNAGALGLYRTQHRIHDAIRELGWEMAGMDVPAPEKKRFYCNVQGVKDD